MASLIDLNAASLPVTNVTSDVCVIGAGAAGLYLAGRLARRGLDVVVLDAGGATCGTGAAVGIEPILSGQDYRGATEGRAFGWGGSTSRWGGLLVPHSELDLRDDGTPESATWKHVVDVVRERTGAVLDALGLGSTPDFFSFADVCLKKTTQGLRDSGLSVIAAEFLPLARRNLTYLAAPRTLGSIRVYLNAVVSRWHCVAGADALGDVMSAEAVSSSQHRLQVTSGSYVIAAGTIESARILLEIDRQHGGRLLPRSARTGCYLSDHLSCSIADVDAEDRSLASRIFAPVFSRGRMRSFRFVDTTHDGSAPRHFAHFIFDIDNPGFRLAKDLLSSLQGRRLPKVSLSAAKAGVDGLVGLAYSRFIKSRLLVPPETRSHLQLDVEQVPVFANRVELGADADPMGRPVAVVHWNVNAIDHENIRSVSRTLLSKWPGRPLRMPRLIPTHAGDSAPKPHDAYHPVGTCRMGTDDEATADLDLRVRGTHNLFVLSTGVFPSAGTANPTFSMLCLGDRLGDRLARSTAQVQSA